MSSTKNLISSSSIHKDVKDNLSEFISNQDNWIYYVFHAQANILNLPTITIIGEGKVMDELINQDWVNNSIELYNIIINVIEMDQIIVNKKTPHNIYYNLNCQWDQLIFYNDDFYDEEIAYFQNNGEKKFLKKTRRWLKQKEEAYTKSLVSYTNNEEKDSANFVFTLKRLQQLLEEIITDFKVIFHPMEGFLKSYTTEQVLSFLVAHSNTVKNKFDRDTTILSIDFYDLTKSPLSIKYLLSILNYQSSTIEEDIYDIKLLINNLGLFAEALSTDFNSDYSDIFKQRVKQLETHIIIEKAKTSVESWEDILENQVKEALKTFYKPKSVFLLSKKYFNIPLTDLKYEKGIHLFIVVLTQKRNYQEIRQFSNLITKQTSGKVKVSVLLQKANNWTRNIPEFLEFYEKHFTNVNLFYGNSIYISYDKDEDIIAYNKNRYTQECFESLNRAYLNIKENSDERFCEAQAMLYHFVIQQSLLLLVYKKLDLIPNIINLSYLWDLIQWCYPSIYKDISDLPTVRKVLFNKDCFIKYYPKPNEFIVDCTLEDIKELDSFCDMIYSFTKEELKDSSLSIVPQLYK
ncbi:hypothetical protein LNQ81_11560 [Myroides sp. M-43]|uniref:hypothetical protein n=1 Tax=Myroides oncorhynchi TaxID=2893756 RepID=UPI001E582C84|nr:hypothetical protein [Myroides oncorhynchi]MCC9043308.1 hypothetical protein [Myroides oncorhynchi]